VTQDVDLRGEGTGRVGRVHVGLLVGWLFGANMNRHDRSLIKIYRRKLILQFRTSL